MICIFDVVTGPATGKRFWLKTQQCIEVGRFSSVDVPIPADRHLSRRHCLIDSFADGFRIRDIGSANGTFVNEQPITVEVLRHGDTVRIGLTTMEVSIREGHESPHSRDGLNFGRQPTPDSHEPNLAEDTVRFRPGQLKPLSPDEQFLAAVTPVASTPSSPTPLVSPPPASTIADAAMTAENSSDDRTALADDHPALGSDPPALADDKSNKSLPRIWGVEASSTLQSPAQADEPPTPRLQLDKRRASTTDWPERSAEQDGRAAEQDALKTREQLIGEASTDPVSKAYKPKTIAFVPPTDVARSSQKWLDSHFQRIGTSQVYELTATFRSQYGELAGLLPQLCNGQPFSLVVNIAQLDAASKQLFDQLVVNSSAKAISRTLLYNVLELTDEIKRFLSFSSGQDAVVCLIGEPPPGIEVLKNFANSLSYPSMLARHLQEPQSELVRTFSIVGVEALFEMESSGRIGLFRPAINPAEAQPR